MATTRWDVHDGNDGDESMHNPDTFAFVNTSRTFISQQRLERFRDNAAEQMKLGTEDRQSSTRTLR